MTDPYADLVFDPQTEIRLAAALIQRRVLELLHEALVSSGLTRLDLARRLGVSAMDVQDVLEGDGNLTVSTLARYLSAMGAELVIDLVPLTPATGPPPAPQPGPEQPTAGS